MYEKERSGPDSITEQMLNAVELFHYSERFHGQCFTFVLGDSGLVADIFTDLKVFHASQIRLMICCRDSDTLRSTIATWNPRGYKFDYYACDGSASAAERDKIAASLRENRVPVIAFKDNNTAALPPSHFHDSALAEAAAQQSSKIFFLSTEPGVVIGDEILSYPSTREIQALLNGKESSNIPVESLRYLWERQQELRTDFVILPAKSGSLFQEVFTHRGSGTLFSQNYKTVFRQAELQDVRDIGLLIKPYVNSGAVLPISEDEIAEQVAGFYLYSINNEIVATAKLTAYGDAYEIAKLSTIPRYRRKGLSRTLVKELLAIARRDGKHFVFSLSTEATMVPFFTGLGFKIVPREELPEAWQRHYDFSRPSRAFRLELV